LKKGPLLFIRLLAGWFR